MTDSINTAPATDNLDALIAANAPPEIPTHGAVDWMKKNLFSSISTTVQTFLFITLLVLILRWLLGLIFDPEASWDSVATNMRLLFTYNYPADQFIRIWFTVGALLTAVGLTIAAWGVDPKLSVKKLGGNLVGVGALIAIMGIIAPASSTIKTGMIVVGVLIAVLGYGISRVLGEQKISFFPFLLVVAGFWLAVLWLVPFGRNEFIDGAVSNLPGTINPSTKIPWTILILLFLGSVLAGRALVTVIKPQALRLTMIAWWVVGPAFLIFLVLRDPQFDYDKVLRTDVPWALGFAIIGGAILYWLAKPGVGEIGRLFAASATLFALFNWVAAFAGWYSMLQKVRLSFLVFALFALAAPTFAGERSVRLKFVYAWVGTVAIGHWLITGINTVSTLDIAAPPFLGGFTLSMVIAYYVMLASFPLGIILALARTSKLPIFRLLSTLYIEFVRGVPLITILFFFSIMVNLFLPGGMELAELAAIFLGYALFSAAYMAENVRGGLQSIRVGQYEASDALGLTTSQRTIFIVLPQALRVTIPNLVGQAIGTFKETSLIAIVGGFDLLNVAKQSIPNQPDFLGQNKPALLFICAIYWAGSYSMSRASRNLETKLGVGTR